jgi:hypothetical protein
MGFTLTNKDGETVTVSVTLNNAGTLIYMEIEKPSGVTEFEMTFEEASEFFTKGLSLASQQEVLDD